MQADRTIRVMVVDDVDHLRFALKAILDMDSELEVAGEAIDGLDAVQKVEEMQPDVILLDLAMPNMDGLQALPQLLKACPQARVLILSGFGRTSLEDQALELGASGYVEKGGDPGAIAEAIKEAHRAPRA